MSAIFPADVGPAAAGEGHRPRVPWRGATRALLAVVLASMFATCRPWRNGHAEAGEIPPHAGGAEASAPPLLDPGALARKARLRARRRGAGLDIERLRRSLEENPWDDEAWESLAWACLAVGRADEAEAAIGSALRVRPYHARHTVVLALCRLARGRSDGVGTLLARATQCSSFPFNHIGEGDVEDVLGRIAAEAVRDAAALEMAGALETNTFRATRTRTEILQAAGRYGHVSWTRREPDNKQRLWIVINGRFMVVCDEDDDVFENHAPAVAHLGLAESWVTQMAFTAGHLMVLADGQLALFDRRKREWAHLDPPAEMRKREITAVGTRDPRSLRVTFAAAEPGGWPVKYVHEPEAARCTPDARGPDWLAMLAADQEAQAFVARRCGGERPPSGFEAACGMSQWRDLKTYLRRNSAGRAASEALDAQGGLSADALHEMATTAGAPGHRQSDWCKGITLPAWWSDALSTPEATDAMERVRRTGAGWVSITPTGYQNDPLSVEIISDPEKTASMESLDSAIERAHALGLRVLLKPHLNLLIEEKDDHMWRGMIHPRTQDGIKAWFDSYEAFLMPYVELAVRRKVEMLTVGVELKSMAGYEDEWRKLISHVRSRGYEGRLTYAALHGGYDRIRFWDALDCVGIDAYFPATKRKDAGLKEIVSGYERLARRLGRFSERVGRPIVFTEVGFNNLNGCNVKPWYWSGNAAEVDNVEQAACYHAMLAVFPPQDWFEGMFWWSWSPSGPPWPSEPSYSPQSKLAELILEAYY